MSLRKSTALSELKFFRFFSKRKMRAVKREKCKRMIDINEAVKRTHN